MFSARCVGGRWLRCVWFGLVCVQVQAAALMPGADEKWRLFQSKNLEVYSRNGEGESREFLHHLELVHAIFFRTFGFVPVRTMPVTVYFFSREKYFEAYKPDAYRKVENIATFYNAALERGVMTVAPLPDYDAARQLAFGSYAFHLLRLLDDRVPVWYSYGVSELFRNLEITPSSLELGKANPQQVARLQVARLIPVEVMLGADQQSSAFMSNQGNNLFHDESWALLHYLYFGRNDLPRERISEFIRYALQNGRPFDAAATRGKFEEAVGLTYAKMDKELERYFRSGRYGWQKLALPAVDPEKSYAMRKVPLAEINTRLAELALQVNRSPQGKLILLQALDRPADTARINEVLGADAARDGDWDVAADRWGRALAAGSTNPAVLHELCRHEGRERFRRFDPDYRLPEETAAHLRDILTKSIAAEPLQSYDYELLAWVEATAGAPQIPNINLIQKNFPRLKEQNRTLLALAVARMRLNDKEGTRMMLDEIEKNQPDDWVRYGVEETRARLEDRPADHELSPAADRPSAGAPPLRLDLVRPRN